MVKRSRFGRQENRRIPSKTVPDTSQRRRFARTQQRRERIREANQQDIQQETLRQAVQKEVNQIDQQIAFQENVIKTLENLNQQRLIEAGTSTDPERVRLLRDRIDRDKDRINDVRRVIQNLENNRSAVEAGQVSATSVVQQSIAIGSESERIRELRREQGTTLQAKRRDIRAAKKRPLTITETTFGQRELKPKVTQDFIKDTTSNIFGALSRGFENFKGEGSLTGKTERLKLEAEVSQFEGLTASLPVVNGIIQVPESQFEAVQKQQQEVIKAQKAFENTFLQKRVQDFAGINKLIREKQTEPFIFKPLERLGITGKSLKQTTKESIGVTTLFAATLTGAKPTKESFKSLQETPIPQFAGGAVEGIYVDVREKPLKQIALVGVGAGIGAGLKLGSVGITAVGGAIGGVKGASIASTISAVGLTGTGAVLASKAAKDIQKKVKEAEGAEQVGSVVGIAAKDLTIVGLGARAGQKSADKLIGKLSTRGLKEVKIEQLSPNRVKEKAFPQIKKGETAQQLVKRFKEPRLPGEKAGTPRSFTATDIRALAKSKKVPIGAKRGGTIKSEFPGRFGADVPSENFLRLGKEGDFKLLGLDRPGGIPSLVRTTLKNIRTPKSSGGKLGVTKARTSELTRLLGGVRGQSFKQIQGQTPTLPSGEAVVPFIKAERELIIPFTTKLTKPTSRFFVNIDGVRVPIFENIAISGTSPTGTIATPTNFEQFITASSSTPSSSAFITPIKFAAATSSIEEKPSGSLPISKISSFVRPTSSTITTSRTTSSRLARSIKRSPPSLTSSDLFSASSNISSVSRSTSTSSTTDISRINKIKKETTPIPRFLGGRSSKKADKDFIVKVRRQGKFKTIGRRKSLAQALNLGKQRTDRSLAATFNVNRLKGTGGLSDFTIGKKFKRKKVKGIGGLTFEEAPKFRLDTPQEIFSIGLSKKKKSKKIK